MRRDGIDLTTLLITAVASAAAAYTCSKIWAPGTLASAAFTPVLVAIIKEALARPTQAVTRAVPVRGVVRSSPPPAEHGDAPAPPEPPPLDRVPQAGEVSYHSTRSSARRWRMAIITGLLGFVIAVLVLTVPELVAGRSASGGGGTTIFGGQQRKQETQTTTAPARTVTVPTPTVTVPAPGNTTSAPAPATTATTPGTTTTTPTSTTPTVTQPPPAQP
jgi:hypothetical protein